jgi:hypothetical protein
MISIERIALDRVPWRALEHFSDRTIFQTFPWIQFVSKTQGAEPVVSVIKRNGRTIGYFTGLLVKRFGLKILGSPLKGWITGSMGFNLPPGFPRREVLAVLPSFAFRDLGCHYLEIVDRHVQEEDLSGQQYAVQRSQNLEIDLTRSEEELFSNMKSACRRCIRKAARSNVSIEEASDMGFADDYYSQLRDVFAKQSLVPTYGIERVRTLIRYLLPTGHLLMLRAKNPEGQCVATGIFPAFNGTAYFFGGASWRAHQMLRPNEALIWYAMRYWKARDMRRFDMGGKASYKRKYGGYEVEVSRLMKGRFVALLSLRNLAERFWGVRQGALGRFKK